MRYRNSILTLLLFSVLAIPSIKLLAASSDSEHSDSSSPWSELRFEECEIEDVEDNDDLDGNFLEQLFAFSITLKILPSHDLEMDCPSQVLLGYLNAPRPPPIA
ncbi:MAG: hypothetical protein AB8B55_17440 [Mariniblastus sp.]